MMILVLLLCTLFFVPGNPQTIKNVYIVFSSHLDVGYTNTPHDVINLHFNTYFPAAARTADQLRQRTGPERLIYMTHSWLISLYIDCDKADIPGNIQCPTSEDRALVYKAIAQGDIVYNAYLFNGQNELVEPSLFRAGLKVSSRLDKFFNRTQPTITMSQRDVPGTTRAIIPHLINQGVQALSVGVNSGSAPPAVPKIFQWLDKSSGTSIIAMWHALGYGGIGVSDCAIVPEIDAALAFAWRGDNEGPPGLTEVLSNFATVRKEFPGANVQAASFDDFVRLVLPVKKSLPVVTQEIGDTWNIFQAADSLKQTYFREIQRARVECISQKKCDPEDDDFQRFDRLLIKISEHTGSVDDTRYLKDYSNWSNQQFQLVKNNKNFQFLTDSFIEQRQYIDNAITLLKSSPFASELKSRLAALKPSVPSTQGFTPVTNLSKIFDFNEISIGFSNAGGISHLVDNTKSKTWSTDLNRIAEYSYITLSAQDYETWLQSYTPCKDIHSTSCDWVLTTHGKFNVSEANPQHMVYLPKLQNLWYKENSASEWEFILSMALEKDSYTIYGGPQTVWSHFFVSVDAQRAITVNVTFSWWKKTSTRLPESHWFNLNPVVANPSSWQMDKLGQLVSPLDIVQNGSHNLHGINPTSGIFYQSSDGHVTLKSLDIPLVSPGKPNALPSPFVVPDLSLGFHYLLTANIWGTNWPGWYPFVDGDENSMFRFEVHLSPQ